QNFAHGSSRSRASANKARASSGCFAATCASASFSTTARRSRSDKLLANNACKRTSATSGTPSAIGAAASEISLDRSARANCARRLRKQKSPMRALSVMYSLVTAADIDLYGCLAIRQSLRVDLLQQSHHLSLRPPAPDQRSSPRT